jgi:hypothetical protein
MLFSFCVVVVVGGGGGGGGDVVDVAILGIDID